MKRIIQLVLLCIVIISVLIFNKMYFTENKEVIVNLDIPSDQLVQKTENNIIKNLKYEVKLEQDNLYIITSGLSELTYIDDAELIEMKDVIAKFIDQDNFTLTIISDEALYNNSNYNTKFRKNVQIEYMNNKIFSDNVDVSFQNNKIRIFNNVKYIGMDGTLNSDNIMIDLITKKVDIYMNNKSDKVELTKK